MANLFFDANYYFDIIERRKESDVNEFANDKLFISPLSIHILIYTYKYRLPNEELLDKQKYFTLTAFDDTITFKALQGPTTDFEDNVQLHSAATAECDYFLTSDKKLLGMKFFGKTKIVSTLSISQLP